MGPWPSDLVAGGVGAGSGSVGGGNGAAAGGGGREADLHVPSPARGWAGEGRGAEGRGGEGEAGAGARVAAGAGGGGAGVATRGRRRGVTPPARILLLFLALENTSQTQIPCSPTTNPKQDSALLAGDAAPAPAWSPRAWSSLCRQAAPRPRPSSSEPSALPPTESREPSASPPADALEEPAGSGEEKAGAPGKEPAGRIRGREGRSSSGRAPPPQAQRLQPRLQRPLRICAQVQTTSEEPLPQGHASPRCRQGCQEWIDFQLLI
ncbi:uncharacterized protein [Miscanthus floridulus]|uniref:uncharacterized protein n=1 Tax=Miscanthus floridulus TaxID=154761 RepID=UPI00345A1C6A